MLKIIKQKNRFNGIILALLLVCSFLVVLVPISQVFAADPTPLTRKWTGYVSGGGESLLTYDAIPGIGGEEIFHAAGPYQPAGGQGRVTCLNGRTGAEIWRTYIPDGLGDTTQIHMVDLDNNGDMEIVVPLQSPAGVYILHAEDGSVMFSDTTLGEGRIDSSPVSGDIDGDGYPDLYLGVMAYEDTYQGYVPNTGKIIHFEYNGANIVERGRKEVWHPCAGGLALGDTDNDGVFELYMNERHVYFGDGSWGRGIMSFWAENLTVRWQVYDWGPSSNIPMLADVNKDGILDVVSTDLGNGVCVLNSSDGRPLENGVGTTLSARGLPRRAHYQSSIYDIDGDGNLELLSADGWEASYDYVTVWDLWDWTLDAAIDTTEVGPYLTRSWKGPTVGEVTGDGLMDIIVVTFAIDQSDNGTLQVYHGNYTLAHVNDELRFRAIDTVVQDIDRNDGGLNELLVLTQDGVIYCYDTLGIASNPRARSEVQFYSESRNGASEYVPYERPWADITSTSPVNGAVGVSTSITSLSFTLYHPEGEQMDYVVTCDPDIISGSGTGNNVGNGLKTLAIDSPLTEATTYHWTITITDESDHVFSKDYWFTTAPYVPNSAPTQTQPSIVGSTTLQDITAYNQTTADVDGDAVTNIYNWQKSGVSIANLNFPFDTQTDLDDEYSGLATTRDYAYGTSGAVFGATWVPDGIVGGAYSFDGNDFIRIEESSNRYDGGGSWDEMSVECWVKATATTSTERLIVKQNRHSDPEIGKPISYRLDYRNRGTRLEFTWRVGIGPLGEEGEYTSYTLPVYYVTSGVTDWHHIVVTYKSGVGLRLYIDGVEVSSVLSPVYAGNILNTDGPFEIAFNSGSDFAGLVDEVRLYPIEISSFMVNQRYLETKDGLSSSSTIPAVETQVGDQWRCQVTPNDGLLDGTTLNTGTVTIIDAENTPPVAGNLTITPASPLTGDDLVANYDYFDAEGHPEFGSVISWYRGSTFVLTSPNLPSSNTNKGETWTFRVTPSDGFDLGTTVVSGPVVIGNTAPSFTGVTITPSPAFDDDTLTANTFGWEDPDGDSESYIWLWQKLVSTVWQNIGGATSQTLTTANFVPGDTLRVTATANDGVDLGNSLIAMSYIVDSEAPTHDAPVLVSSSGNNGTDEDLIVTPQNTYDADGDDVTNVYNWIIDGDSYANLVMPFETNSSTTAQDYSGFGNDGVVSGATYADGLVGGAYNFDGNDLITVADSASLGNDGTWSEITLEYWVNPSENQNGARIFNKNGGAAGDSGKYMTGFNTNGPANVVFFGITTGGSYLETYSDSDTIISSGVWSHIVATYESGDGIKIYINGDLKASNLGVTGNIDASVGEDLFIGYASSIAGTANRYLKGLLDDVRIYPTALSAAQVAQRFMETKDGLSSSATIVPQETELDEVWSCEVTPNDGWQNGVTLTSNTVTIQEGGPRTLIVEDLTAWYWTSNTEITCTIEADVDGDTEVEIVTGGYYSDGGRDIAQLVVWDGATLTVENIMSWYWTGDTRINSVAVADVDGDDDMEIVTGGYYTDGVRIAQMVTWDGTTLAVEDITTWYWTSDTEINSVVAENVDDDANIEIVTGGYFNDGDRDVAQLVTWNGADLAVENIRTWYWTGDTRINSVAVADVDGDDDMEIVTGGYYTDGVRIAQLVTWDGATLAVEDITTWYWTSDTEINSVGVADVDGDSEMEIVTGGYYTGLVKTAQLITWGIIGA